MRALAKLFVFLFGGWCRAQFAFQLGHALFQQRQLLAGAQQHLSLYVELFAVNQIRAGQLRLQDLTDFFSTSSPNSRTPLGMDS